MLTYKEIKPAQQLAKYIKCFWILEGTGPQLAEREKIYPDGCTEWMFHYGDFIRQYKDGTIYIPQQRSFIYGQITQFVQIVPAGKVGILGVRFHPAGIWPFLQLNMNALTDTQADASEIFGPEIKHLEERIMQEPSELNKVAILEQSLLQKLSCIRNVDGLINDSIERINASKGNIRITALAKRYAISLRHLERRFTSVIGLSPKMYSRIVRFKNIHTDIRYSNQKNLTTLAYDNGYFDQAHFIKEFEAFTGEKPSHLLAIKDSFSDKFISV